jgi:hypothetical protein
VLLLLFDGGADGFGDGDCDSAASCADFMRDPLAAYVADRSDAARDPSASVAALQQAWWPAFGKALLRRLSDPADLCRRKALCALTGCLAHARDLGPCLPYLAPALAELGASSWLYDIEQKAFAVDAESAEWHRRGRVMQAQQSVLASGAQATGAGSTRVAEPSEAVREGLADLIRALVLVSHAHGSTALLHPYLHDLLMMAHALAVDPAPPVRLRGCRALVALAWHAPEAAQHYAVGTVRSLMCGGLDHRLGRVRRASLWAVDAFVRIEDKAKVRGAGAEAILHLLGTREANVVPISAFYTHDVTVNYLAKLVADPNRGVREACLRVLTDWITTLPDRHEWYSRLLPYVLSALGDDSDTAAWAVRNAAVSSAAVSSSEGADAGATVLASQQAQGSSSGSGIPHLALQCLARVGAMHESDHRDALLETIQLGMDGDAAAVDYARPLPPPFPARPSFGLRLFVRANARRFFKPILEELHLYAPQGDTPQAPSVAAAAATRHRAHRLGFGSHWTTPLITLPCPVAAAPSTPDLFPPTLSDLLCDVPAYLQASVSGGPAPGPNGPSSRQRSAHLLLTVLTCDEEMGTQDAHLLVPAVVRLMHDWELGPWAQGAARLLGRFIAPEALLPVLLPFLDADPALVGRATAATSEPEVLAAALHLLWLVMEEAKPSRLLPLLPTIMLTLAKDHICSAIAATVAAPAPVPSLGIKASHADGPPTPVEGFTHAVKSLSELVPLTARNRHSEQRALLHWTRCVRTMQPCSQTAATPAMAQPLPVATVNERFQHVRHHWIICVYVVSRLLHTRLGALSGAIYDATGRLGLDSRKLVQRLGNLTLAIRQALVWEQEFGIAPNYEPKRFSCALFYQKQQPAALLPKTTALLGLPPILAVAPGHVCDIALDLIGRELFVPASNSKTDAGILAATAATEIADLGAIPSLPYSFAQWIASALSMHLVDALTHYPADDNWTEQNLAHAAACGLMNPLIWKCAVQQLTPSAVNSCLGLLWDLGRSILDSGVNMGAVSLETKSARESTSLVFRPSWVEHPAVIERNKAKEKKRESDEKADDTSSSMPFVGIRHASPTEVPLWEAALGSWFSAFLHLLEHCPRLLDTCSTLPTESELAPNDFALTAAISLLLSESDSNSNKGLCTASLGSSLPLLAYFGHLLQMVLKHRETSSVQNPAFHAEDAYACFEAMLGAMTRSIIGYPKDSKCPPGHINLVNLVADCMHSVSRELMRLPLSLKRNSQALAAIVRLMGIASSSDMEASLADLLRILGGCAELFANDMGMEGNALVGMDELRPVIAAVLWASGQLPHTDNPGPGLISAEYTPETGSSDAIRKTGELVISVCNGEAIVTSANRQSCTFNSDEATSSESGITQTSPEASTKDILAGIGFQVCALHPTIALRTLQSLDDVPDGESNSVQDRVLLRDLVQHCELTRSLRDKPYQPGSE